MSKLYLYVKTSFAVHIHKATLHKTHLDCALAIWNNNSYIRWLPFLYLSGVSKPWRGQLASDLAHYNDGRSVHHFALDAYQLQLELVLREVAAAKGSSHISVAVDLVRELFKVRLSKVRLREGNSPGIEPDNQTLLPISLCSTSP